jgi:hypothetical protein
MKTSSQLLTVAALALGALFVIDTPRARDVEATTADGRTVSLSDDGTWQFKESAALDAAPGAVITRPKTATKAIKSKKGFFELWYNPKKWTTKEGAEGTPTEFVVIRKDGDAYAMAIVERIGVPMQQLSAIALNNARSQAPDAKIVLEEERTVNGKKVVALQIEGTIQGIAFKYYGYYWSGKSGTVQFLTYTAQNLFEDALPDFTELLSGFVITQG